MTAGSSALTVEQQEWFLTNRGVRYHHVQDNYGVPSRRDRRANTRARRCHGDGRPVDALASLRRGR